MLPSNRTEFKPIVYISMPLRADSFREETLNILEAAQVAASWWKKGEFFVICPHMNTWAIPFFAEIPHEDFIRAECDFIKTRMGPDDYLVLGPGWSKSTGCRAEHTAAKLGRVKILYPKDEEE